VRVSRCRVAVAAADPAAPAAALTLFVRPQLREGVDTEIAAASREGKRAARSKASVTTGARSKASATVAQAKYSRFEAEVGQG
jgi:hypothetical protein